MQAQIKERRGNELILKSAKNHKTQLFVHFKPKIRPGYPVIEKKPGFKPDPGQLGAFTNVESSFRNNNFLSLFNFLIFR